MFLKLKVMIITYTQGRPDVITKGKDWEANRWRKSTDMDIVKILWQTIVANRELDFNQITELIKNTYKNKTVRSKISINYEEAQIEIIKKGIFPNIIIQKLK